MAQRICLLWSTFAKKFRAIAKEAFGKIYCGADKQFNVFAKSYTEDGEKLQYESIFEIFGENMGAIAVWFFNEANTNANDQIIENIMTYCNSLTHVKITSGNFDLASWKLSKLVYLELRNFKNKSWAKPIYPKLIHLHTNCNAHELNKFFATHNKLETLLISCRSDFGVSIKANLPRLKNLNIFGSRVSDNAEPIEIEISNNMNNLETFGLFGY